MNAVGAEIVHEVATQKRLHKPVANRPDRQKVHGKGGANRRFLAAIVGNQPTWAFASEPSGRRMYHAGPISLNTSFSYTNWTFGIPTTVTRAIIYTRVSTAEQGESGLGLDAQTSICNEYCLRNNIQVVETKSEIQSGKTTRKRPELASALDSLRRGDADILIASNVSRLSRSIGDLVGLLTEADKHSYSVVALDTGLDTSSPAGRMVFQILGVAAEYERAMTSDRTKKALARAKAKGTQLGRRTTLPIEVVHRISTERAQGRTLRAIADDLNSENVATGQGGARWYPATVAKVLSRVS